jgi:hypothetical protein
LIKPVRRIVTGHNAEGRSVFIMDGPAPDAYPAPASAAMTITLLWRTTTVPASFAGNDDMAPAGLRVPTAPQQRGGTVFRIADIPPDSELGATADMARHGVNVSAEWRQRHVMFHQTDTVDYAAPGHSAEVRSRRRCAPSRWNFAHQPIEAGARRRRRLGGASPPHVLDGEERSHADHQQ